MPALLEEVAEAALAGKNIVITTAPGIGTVSKTLATLEDAGLVIGHIDAPYFTFEMLEIFVPEGDILRPVLVDEAIESEVLVFDGIDGADAETLKTITEVMTSRTLYGRELPSVKTVVAIFTTAVPNPAVSTLAALENTVEVTVR